MCCGTTSKDICANLGVKRLAAILYNQNFLTNRMKIKRRKNIWHCERENFFFFCTITFNFCFILISTHTHTHILSLSSVLPLFVILKAGYRRCNCSPQKGQKVSQNLHTHSHILTYTHTHSHTYPVLRSLLRGKLQKFYLHIPKNMNLLFYGLCIDKNGKQNVFQRRRKRVVGKE